MLKSRTLALVLAVTLALTLIALAPALAEDNKDSVGVADQTTGIWYLRSPNGATTSFYFGNPGDYPFMGDWNCDDIDTPGLYRQSDGYVYLRNSNTQGNADISFYFGNPGDIPIAGDFNADGCDTVSIYRPSNQTFYIINKLGTSDGGLGAANYSYIFGNPGDKPFMGDFNDNGQDTPGLHRESTGLVYYRNTNTTGNADNTFIYGDPGDQIIAGRWVQNPNPGPDTVGIFRPSQGRFYLRFTNSQGNADVSFQYGNSNMAAVAGYFGNLPGGDPAPPVNTTTTTAPATDGVLSLQESGYLGNWSGSIGSDAVYLARGRDGSLWSGNVGSDSAVFSETLAGGIWSGVVGSVVIDLAVTGGTSIATPHTVTGWIGSDAATFKQNLSGTLWTCSVGGQSFFLDMRVYGKVTGSSVPRSVAAIAPMLESLPGVWQ